MSNGSFQGGPIGDYTVQPLSQPLFYVIRVAAIADVLITQSEISAKTAGQKPSSSQSFRNQNEC